MIINSKICEINTSIYSIQKKKRWSKMEIFLINEFLEEKKSIKFIACYFNVSANAISKAIQRHLFSPYKRKKNIELNSFYTENYLNSKSFNILRNIIKDNHYLSSSSLLFKINKTLIENKLEPISYTEFLKIQLIRDFN